MSALNLQAPAKINLFLAVTGRRTDGYHDLVSVAAPLVWGDSISAEPVDGPVTVTCDDPMVPLGEANLVARAAAVFAAATGWSRGVKFTVTKRIPMGAGLGGASSDATSALLALNALSGHLLDEAGLLRAASAVGSDCALFLARAPVVMRGRGERIEPLGKEAYGRIRGMRLLVFKPEFPVPTPWAYAQLAAAAPASYVPLEEAESLLAGWLGRKSAPVQDLVFNSMEGAVFAKFPALPILLEELWARFGIVGRMSGSGSACFAFLGEDAPSGPIEALVREAWGASAFVVDTRIA